MSRPSPVDPAPDTPLLVGIGPGAKARPGITDDEHGPPVVLSQTDLEGATREEYG